jgi:hypothetical protein
MNLEQAEHRSDSLEFETGEGDEVEAGQDGETTFVVADEAAKAGLPGEGPLHHPAARQEDEAPLGLRQFDDLEVYAVGRGVGGWRRPGIPLVSEGDLDRVSGRLLDSLGEIRDLCPILSIGRRGGQGQQVPKGVHRHVDLATLATFGSIVPTVRPALGG